MKRRLLSIIGLATTAVMILGWTVAALAETPPYALADSQAYGSMTAVVANQASSPLTIPQLGESGISYRYSSTFGTADAPYFEDTTHINVPNALATDGTDVWVTEAYGLRAMKFDQNGAFLKQIGSAGRAINVGNGMTNVTWDHLSDVTVDASHNVWVLDEWQNSITKFDEAGAFVSQLGIGWGIGNYQFRQPSGIAFDSAGNIYVGDRSNHRVQIYDSVGAYKATLGVTGTPGAGNYQFNQPLHVTVGADNRLYVADSQNNRVQIYDLTDPASPIYFGTLGTTGVSGNDNAHFKTTEGVAVDAGRIYVTDGWNHRVQVFNRATLAYQATIGASAPNWGSANDQLSGPSDVAIDSVGNVYVADFLNSRVQKFSPSLSYLSTIGTTGVPYLTDNSRYFTPSGVAVAVDGSYYVVEERGQRLIKRDAAGALLWQVGSPGVFGWDNQHFIYPTGVALDAAGRVHVADRGNNRVQVYNSDGAYYLTLGSGWGTGNYQFNCPNGIAISASGDIYVADMCNQRVQVYDDNYVFKYSLGQTGVSGSDDNHFNNPVGIAVDSLGTIYVADRNNYRVQVFDATSHAYVRTIGVTGSNNCGSTPRDPGRFCNPASVAVDTERRVYVGDLGRVQVFDQNGAYLTTVGGGDYHNADQLRSAAGLTVDRSDNLWVADRDYARVQKYARYLLKVFLPFAVRP